MKRTSVWVDTGPEHDERPQLDGDVDAEVCVIGGGIVGITTAALLQDAGVRTVLLEANRLACGVSGFTTAKVSSQHGLVYARLRSRFGRDAAATYGAANQAALAWMAERVEQDGIECDWRRRSSYAYLTEDRATALPPTAPPIRPRWSGWPRASSTTGSSATGAGDPPTPT